MRQNKIPDIDLTGEILKIVEYYEVYISVNSCSQIRKSSFILNHVFLFFYPKELETYQYIANKELHRSTFINKALSGESRIYTITNVFKLVEKGTSNSRVKRMVRRDIIDNAQAPLGKFSLYRTVGQDLIFDRAIL